MNLNLNRSDKRGTTDFGWLKVRHSFSFGDYFNPVREKFGVIRVLNDELLSPESSLEMHEYRDLEIMLIPIEGSLQIESPGLMAIELAEQDVALITAGSGLKYALHNPSSVKPVNLLQVWFFPKKKNVSPSINTFHLEKCNNHYLQQVIAEPLNSQRAINQDVWVSRVCLGKNKDFTYEIVNKENQVLVFVIEGEVVMKDCENSQTAKRRDTIEISSPDNRLNLNGLQLCDLLIIETIPD